jgi:hemolysin III
MMKRSSLHEELANSITHGIGALLALAGLVILVVLAALKGTALHLIGFSVFGSAMLVLYVMSTLYHSITHERAKLLFRKFDHMAIYLLIAGTYTPFCLTALQGWLGWTLLGIVWSCALAGVVLKIFFTGKREKLSTGLYIALGWMCVLAAKPLYDALPPVVLTFLVLGGVFYTAGTFFYLMDYKRYFHSIWHVFVLAGTVAHFFAVILLLL